jgi:hypothetical protein
VKDIFRKAKVIRFCFDEATKDQNLNPANPSRPKFDKKLIFDQIEELCRLLGKTVSQPSSPESTSSDEVNQVKN